MSSPVPGRNADVAPGDGDFDGVAVIGFGEDEDDARNGRSFNRRKDQIVVL